MGVMGITRVANVTGLDRVGIPVVMVCRPNARSVAVAQGKGVSVAAAKTSGLMESVESYHAECVAGPLLCGSVEELRYERRIVDIEGLPRRRGTSFTPHTRLLWMPGSDLLANDESTLVPIELGHLDFGRAGDAGETVFAASSNGLASGNSILEAISHGICEIVERDATTLWHLSGVRAHAATRIDIATVDDALCLDLLDRFRAADALAAVWDTTTDIGVPSFLCRVIPDGAADSHFVRPATGMGCHPAREVALQRALTEAAQSRLTFISGARDDLFRADYQQFLGPEGLAPWRASMLSEEPRRDFRDVPSWRGDSLEDAVAWLLGRLRSAGVQQAIAVDLTKPGFDVPVVRMIIPGLEGIDGPDYLPGRRAAAILSAVQ